MDYSEYPQFPKWEKNSALKSGEGLQIRNVQVRDMRWPTSLGGHGSDAMHTDPDYSCAYVVIYTMNGAEGHGLTFTLGRGTEIVVQAVHTLSQLVIGKDAADIFNNFGAFWRKLTSETQLRWIGPEKGVMHLATAALVNALWDLWARVQHKPLWKLIADMEPEQLVNCIDFRYISDVITPQEAIKILKEKKPNRDKMEREVLTRGYPAYTTQVGWLGYSNETVTQLCHKYLSEGFTAFKVKVGQDLADDKRRCKLVREIIGNDKILMVDANQNWDVQEAIDWMKELAEFKPLWIEEPTSPDDVLGHLAVSKALAPLGISVATGEMCCNRVLFKQFLQSGAMQYCQIDSARIGGVNEILAVYLMAYKLGVKVCPHAGGVGLCEMVQHLQLFDFICLSQTSEGRWIEYVDQQHEQFVNPVHVRNSHYMPPKAPGYSTELKREAAEGYEWPVGFEWQKLFASGKFVDPRTVSTLPASKH